MNELVRQAQRGDKGAFEQLYREHVGRIYALCLRLSADSVRAEELTQDVFVRAWKSLARFRGEAALSSWLHRIAVNVFLQSQRSETRRRARTVSGQGAQIAEAGSGTSPQDVGVDLERAIRALPTGARSVFILHDIEGYGHEEIARMTGTAIGTSKAQLHRARRLLREALGR